MFKRENLVLIEKYGRFVEYIYKPTINTNRKHKVARDALVWAPTLTTTKRIGINEN